MHLKKISIISISNYYYIHAIHHDYAKCIYANYLLNLQMMAEKEKVMILQYNNNRMIKVHVYMLTMFIGYASSDVDALNC